MSTVVNVGSRPSKSKPRTISPHANWLTYPISREPLIQLGFLEADREQGQHHATVRVANTITTLNNISDMDAVEVYYFAPLDIILLKRDDGKWCLSQDSECDSFWKGDLKTMSDVLSVMILLSR